MKRLSTILLSFVIFMSLMPIQTGVFVFADDNSADALAKAKAEYELRLILRTTNRKHSIQLNRIMHQLKKIITRRSRR